MVLDGTEDGVSRVCDVFDTGHNDAGPVVQECPDGLDAVDDHLLGGPLRVYERAGVRWCAQKVLERRGEPWPPAGGVDDAAGLGLDVDVGAVSLAEVLDLAVDLVGHELLREKRLVEE